MMSGVAVYMALFKRQPQGRTRGDFLGGLFYGSNWYQIFVGQGYTSGEAFVPFRHLWSLAVEEQFYLIWPLVMVAILRVGPRRLPRVAVWLAGVSACDRVARRRGVRQRRRRHDVCAGRDERLLEGVRSLHQRQRDAVPQLVHTGRRLADRRGVRHGVAADGAAARRGAQQGPPARPARPRRTGRSSDTSCGTSRCRAMATRPASASIRGCSAAGSSSPAWPR